MDQAHKQRLVGGIVLLALGLILVPTILDFSQDAPDPMAEAQIPESPDVMKMEVLPLEVWSEPVDPEIDNSNRIVETPSAVEQKMVKPSSEPAPKPVEPDAKKASAAKPASVAKAETAANSTSDTTKKSAIPAGASGWVVQIASFSEEPKAFALRDRLRKAGHPVFIERGRKDGVIYRVKVGPVLQRAEADHLKKLVAKQTKLDGLVMKYR